MAPLPRSGIVALALLIGVGLAAAQQTPPGTGQGENLASPQQKGDQEKAQQSEAGRAGTTEPSAQAPSIKPVESAAFADGRLTAPGAPADSQTVPAKFSQHNAALDALPTMAFPLKLTDEQRQRIRAAVGKAPVANANVQAADLLPSSVAMQALPTELAQEIPGVGNLGFVRTADSILLVTALQRIVVERISDQKPAN